MKFLFLFMDGIGLGEVDPAVNPLWAARMPNLDRLLDGRKLTRDIPPFETDRASLISLDAVMGVEGMPQSATGQASLLTGKNVPALIGKHYGPKPNRAVREVLAEGTLFSVLTERGYQTALLNAYPEGYFEAIENGKRLYSAIPHAVVNAGVELKRKDDLYARKALSADFTGEGWRTYLKYADAPVSSPEEAGRNMAEMAAGYDFAFFEFWPSDYAGHRQDLDESIRLLEQFDQVLGGLVDAWDDTAGLILVTSDHGNMEDLNTRRHTTNPVPALVVGAPELRRMFVRELHTLADIAPAILQFYQ